jgi:hypothetical protein
MEIYKDTELDGGKPLFRSWAGGELSKCIAYCIEYSKINMINTYLEFNGFTKELSSLVDAKKTQLEWYNDNYDPIRMSVGENRDAKINQILGE